MHRYEYGTKIGYSASIGTTFQPLSNANVVDLSSEAANVVSTSTDDTITGTGVQKVRIIYLTNTWEEKTEIVTLNGTTPVPTINNDLYLIEKFEAIQTGINIKATGTITLKSLDGARLFAQIDPGTNTFRRALHYVRPGHLCTVTGWIFGSSSSGGVIFSIQHTIDFTSIGGGYVDKGYLCSEIVSSTAHIPLIQPLIIDALHATQPLKVYVSVTGRAEAQNATASFNYIEVHND